MKEIKKKIDRFNKLYGGDIAFQDLTIIANYIEENGNIRFTVYSCKNYKYETIYIGMYAFDAFYHETIHSIATTILSNALLHVLETGRI